MSNIKDWQKMIQKLDLAFVGRSNESKGLILALLTGEHVFLLGPPGTGKSMLIRALTRMVNGRLFSWLLSPFTTPEDLLGPVSFSGLQRDKYQRVFTGKLPEADIAFLDEIWKASAIHNILLTLVNEREVYDGGGAHIVPLHSLFCASNELPQSDMGLEAIYDRILFRYFVRELSPNEMLNVIQNPICLDDFDPVIDMDRVRKDAQRIQADVRFSKTTAEMLCSVRQALEAEGICVSTRRYMQAIKVLKANAWIEEDDEVVGDHFSILTDIFWRKPDERAKVVDVVNKIAAPTRLLVQEILDAIIAESSEISSKNMPKTQYMTAVSDLMEHIREAEKRMNSFGSKKPSVVAGLNRLRAIEKDVTQQLLLTTTGRSNSNIPF